NPAPRFLLRGVSVVSSRTVGSGGAHLKATFGKDGVRKDGIAFGMGGTRLGGGAADIVAGIARNEYNGYVGAQLAVKAILPGDPAFAPDTVAEARSALTELSRQGGDAEAPERIASLPPLNGHRGTLFACRCAGTANMLRRAMPDLMVFTQCADDPRGFHALCLYPDWDAAHARFDTVVLADGALHPGEAARAKAATGAARVLAMPRNPALTEMLGACRTGVDELRDAWRALRDGMDLSLQMPPCQALACRMILGEMGLARLDGNGAFVSMLPASGAQPEASALYRALNEL
ncbi:MAG TPA: hypothetical protein VLA21_01460, partial [Candidatus Limnocylindria bacterium]|nr:hypothetical protein [Candidatus Limnocylindria bacterium]